MGCHLVRWMTEVSGVILFDVFRRFAAIRGNLGVGFYLVGLLYVVDFLDML